MFLMVILILVLVVLFFKFSKKGIPKIVQDDQSKPTKPIPSATELLVGLRSVDDVIGNFNSVCENYTEHGIASFWMGPLKLVMVWEPELIEEVTNCPATQSKGYFYRILFGSVANGVFAHPGGQEWKELRKPIVLSMSKKLLENDYFDEFVFKARDLVDFLKQKREGQCFDIGHDMCATVLDTFLATHVGVRLNDLWDRKWMISDLIDTTFEISLNELAGFFHYFVRCVLFFNRLSLKIINLLTSLNIFMKGGLEGKSSAYENNQSLLYEGKGRIISEFFAETCSNIRLRLISYWSFYESEVNFGLTKVGRVRRNIECSALNFLTWVMAERINRGMDNLGGVEYYSDFLIKRKKLHNLKEKKILKELVDVIAAGADTSPVVGSAILLFVAMHPEIQERLYREQQELFGDSDRDPTFEDLSKMNYLDMVVKETLRIVSPPGIAKVSDKACIIGKYRVPKGNLLLVYARGVHSNPKYYEKPYEFYPEHFLPEVEANRPRYAFVPFGIGTRKCPGFLYADNLLKVLVSMVVRNFTLKSSLTMETIKFDYRIMHGVRGGYPVEIKSRKR